MFLQITAFHFLQLNSIPLTMLSDPIMSQGIHMQDNRSRQFKPPHFFLLSPNILLTFGQFLLLTLAHTHTLFPLPVLPFLPPYSSLLHSTSLLPPSLFLKVMCFPTSSCTFPPTSTWDLILSHSYRDNQNTYFK